MNITRLFKSHTIVVNCQWSLIIIYSLCIRNKYFMKWRGVAFLTQCNNEWFIIDRKYIIYYQRLQSMVKELYRFLLFVQSLRLHVRLIFEQKNILIWTKIFKLPLKYLVQKYHLRNDYSYDFSYIIIISGSFGTYWIFRFRICLFTTTLENSYVAIAFCPFNNFDVEFIQFIFGFC